MLLTKAVGVWGTVAGVNDKACATRFRYSTERRGADDFIVIEGDHFQSVARVTAVSDQSIFTRTVTPQEKAGTQWELRLEADRLIQVDAANVGTTLMRCGN